MTDYEDVNSNEPTIVAPACTVMLSDPEPSVIPKSLSRASLKVKDHFRLD
jgi:hypothetical protein